MSTVLLQRMSQDLRLAGLGERLAEHNICDAFLSLKNDCMFASASLAIADFGIKFFDSHTTPRDWPTLKR